MSGSGRTFVVIFFFWAALTIITPTLVHMSESAKIKSSSNGERIEATSARKMMLYLKRPSRSFFIVPEATKAAFPAPAPAPAPMPVPAPPTPGLALKLAALISHNPA